MKRLDFSKQKEKYCKYCTHGKYLEYTDEVFCTKKGFVDKFGKCLKYKYDPLKRQPDKKAIYSEYSADDFKL